MPIKTVDSSILKRKDRTVEIAFKQLDDEKPRPSAFCSEINTISPCDECLAIREYLTGVRIKWIDWDGKPVYAFSDLTGHKFFDVCDCDQCQIDSDEEETAKRKSSRSKSSQQKLKERYESRDPEVNIFGESSGMSFAYYVLYPAHTPEQNEVHDCYMFSPSLSQEPTFCHMCLSRTV